MISCDKGKVQIKGSLDEVMVDYASLTQHMIKVFKEKGLSDELIDILLNEANRVSRMSPDELAQANRELEVRMMMKLFK